MDYEPYLEQGLTSFEDVLNAFTQFKDGGYWVKKIVKKGSFHREIVEGPYKKKEAEYESEEWNKFFKFEDKIVAEVFTFFTLCCDFELDERKKAYLYPEYIWQPPKGIEIFCLLYKPEKAIIKARKDISDKNTNKFINYALSNDIGTIEVYQDIIYYNTKNYKSLIEAKVLKRICIDYIQLEREKRIFLEYVIDNKLGDELVSIPDYITEFKTSCFTLYLSEFKEFLESNENCRDKIKKFYTKQYKCLPKENLHLSENTIVLDMYLLLSKRDYQAKLIKIAKNDKFSISIGNDDYHIKLDNIEKCTAFLKIKLPKDLIDFTDYYAQGDKKFQETKNFIGLILYIAKCLGIGKIEYNADQQMECICDNQGILLYEELVILLAGEESIYKKLGFINNKQKELDSIIDKNKNITVREVLKKEKNSEDEEDDLFLDKTIGQVSQMYLDGVCNYEYGCTLMDEINKFIYPQLSDVITYSLSLKDKNLKFLRGMF
tara:strand:+ start:1150 stop:2616 length:1467 start_codon:yes stop_codon:yes gene_type:complete